MPRDRFEPAGPWLFDAPQLTASERWVVNLEEEPNPRTPNGPPGWFRPYLPLDEIKVHNRDGSNEIEVTINGRYPFPVPPNTIEPFTDTGIRYWAVVNQGSTTIAAGDVTATVAQAGWTADKQARDRRNTPWVKRAVGDIIPGGPF